MRGRTHLVLVPLALLATAGCATKQWVNDLVGGKQAQVDARLAKTEAQATEASRRFDGRVGTLEASIGEARETAKQAGARADAAHARAEEAYTRADEVNGRVTRLWNGRYKRSVVETLHVQFAFDRHDLSDGAQTALLAIVREMQENAQLTVDLEGFADPVGTRDYNVALSERRVEAVRRFLVDNGADLSRIYAVGRGAVIATAATTPAERAKDRRVTVKLMINPD